jgi:60 kDa SS-A/Ro ribonucleoprotein
MNYREELKQYINIRRKPSAPVAVTPQSQPIPGRHQQMNSAGGFTWTVSPWTRLDRFLILGSEGGAFYVNQRRLTIENTDALLACMAEDGPRVVARIVEVSEGGKAAKNEPALFALALCAALGEPETRRAALAALPRVARTGTHLFHFLGYVDSARGWGRGLRTAVAEWYNGMAADKLAYQAVKYQQREGWSHRDALRLAHPQPASEAHSGIYRWITQGWKDESLPALEGMDEAMRLIWVYEQAKRAGDEAEIVQLIEAHRLTWEFVPSNFLGSAAVWRALLPNLPLTATVRNLGRMTANGALGDGAMVESVVARLANREYIHRSRLHPLAVLVALRTYQSGQGVRGSLAWEPVRQIVDALDTAFYMAFDNVAPTGKRIMLALDVSGSMMGPEIANMPGITPRVAAAALAMATARSEKEYIVTVFSATGNDPVTVTPGGVYIRSGISPFDISSRERLDDVLKRTEMLPFGGTDCALPMLYSLERKLAVDAFVVYTDNETWAGAIHPAQALVRYRQQTGIDAKLVVVGMVSNGFTIADPNDAGMLDVVGLSTETPQVISHFTGGEGS